jgi:hypothetical protein
MRLEDGPARLEWGNVSVARQLGSGNSVPAYYDMERQRRHRKMFMAMAFGDPEQYAGYGLRAGALSNDPVEQPTQRWHDGKPFSRCRPPRCRPRSSGPRSSCLSDPSLQQPAPASHHAPSDHEMRGSDFTDETRSQQASAGAAKWLTPKSCPPSPGKLKAATSRRARLKGN